MENTVKACITLHNMVCEEKRDGFPEPVSCRLRMESENLESPQEAPVIVPCDDEIAGFWSSHLE